MQTHAAWRAIFIGRLSSLALSPIQAAATVVIRQEFSPLLLRWYASQWRFSWTVRQFAVQNADNPAAHNHTRRYMIVTLQMPTY